MQRSNILRIQLTAIRFLIALIFTSSCLNGQVNKALYNQLLKNPDGKAYQMPVGTCEDYPEETTTIESIRNDMEFLKSSGIKLLRISFGWDAIEESQGKYNWLFWDDFVKMAVDKYGITLIPYVCYMPKWNSECGDDSLNYWTYPPKDYSAFSNFMKALTARYKKWIKTWEIWNEPDNPSYWRGSAAEFAKLLTTGASAVREADPAAKIVLGGIAVNTEFLRTLFKDYEAGKIVDAVNFHNYYETWSSDPIEAITAYINEVADIVDNYGRKQALWIAEVGYSTWRMGGRKVSNDYNAYYDYEHSYLYQGVQLFKTLTLIASTGRVSAAAWYEIKDLPADEGVIGDNNNRNLGISYFNRAPKPAEKSLMFFNKLFGGSFRCIDNEVKVEKPDSSDAEFHTFRKSDGSVIAAGWLKTVVPAERGKDTSEYAADLRKELISISIPEAPAGKVSVYDEIGNLYPFGNIVRNAGTIRLYNILLKGGSIFITEISGRK